MAQLLGALLGNTGDMQQLLHRAPQLKELAALARAGKKLEAIKLYRELFDVDLAQAKDAVEKIASGSVMMQFGEGGLVTPENTPLTPHGAQMQAIHQALQADNKIEAIRLFREMTGVGLKEAKEAIEQMQANQAVDFSAFATTSMSVSASGSTSEAGAIMAVQTLMRMGKKIEAIKVYRQLTGVGLAEAKAAVERMEAGDTTPPVTLPSVNTSGAYRSFDINASPGDAPESAGRPMWQTCALMVAVLGVLGLCAVGAMLAFVMMR
jgi:ribosomal protein L7/L12